MTLGGVILASLGIVLVVLVAAGRWPNVWNAALGGSTTVPSGTAASSLASTTTAATTAATLTSQF